MRDRLAGSIAVLLLGTAALSGCGPDAGRTRPEPFDQPLRIPEVASYDLGDLVADGPDAAARVEGIAGQIRSGVCPAAWKSGRPASSTIEVHGRTLLVCARTAGLQPQVAGFLLKRYEADMPPDHRQLHAKLAARGAVDLEAVPLGLALESLSASSGIRAALAAEATGCAALPVSVRFREASNGLTLRRLARSAGLEWRFRDGGVLLERPVAFGPVPLHRLAAARRVDDEVAKLSAAAEAALSRELGAPDFDGKPLGECLAWFRERMGADIVCDPACLPKLAGFRVALGTDKPEVRETLTDLAAGEALALVVKSAGLRVGLRDGAILVLGGRAETPLKGVHFRLAEARVTFDWTARPAAEALAFLAKAADVRLVVEESAREAAARTITLKMKDAPADVALEFVLRRCRLTARISEADGTLYVAGAR